LSQRKRAIRILGSFGNVPLRCGVVKVRISLDRRRNRDREQLQSKIGRCAGSSY
jgi:hypothetical protein